MNFFFHINFKSNKFFIILRKFFFLLYCTVQSLIVDVFDLFENYTAYTYILLCNITLYPRSSRFFDLAEANKIYE